jgi:flagellar basal body-associated protein FliL
MAADTVQAGQAPAGGETPAAETTPAKAGGLSSYLPLIIAIVVMPVAAWVTITVKARMGKSSAGTTEAAAEHEAPAKAEDAHGKAPAKDAHGKAPAKDAHGKATSSSKPGWRNVKLPVPLTRDAVMFVEKDTSKPGDTDKFVTLDIKGDPKELAQSDKIVVNIANTSGQRYVLVRISMISDHPEFVERLNENRERLIDTASGSLSSKTLEDLNKIGFKTLLKSELQSLFNQQLSSAIIQEVLLHEFVQQ